MPLLLPLEHCPSWGPSTGLWSPEGQPGLLFPAGGRPSAADTHTLWAWSQVSHHPPSAAHYVFSKNGWSLWQEITISSKFRGKYLSIMPLGELGPVLSQGREPLWTRGRVSPNPEASSGPLGVTQFPCSLPPGFLGASLARAPFPSLHEYCFQFSGPRDCGEQASWGLAPRATTSDPVSISPPGAIHLEFQASGNHYVWRKSTSTVHNIIVGKLWIDQVTGCPRAGGCAPVTGH